MGNTRAAKVEALLALVAKRGARPGPAVAPCASAGAGAGVDGAPVSNVVAFSGGIDSSLTAALVHQVFPNTSAACIGRSAALSTVQLQRARDVAAHIGVPLWECHTEEAELDGYVANEGQSCYYCKTTLYATLNQVATFARQEMQRAAGRDAPLADDVKPVLYNGTNADDQLDPTRVGLVAAKEYDVVSPLSGLTKQEVRDVAKYMGLPNWNDAASPCLRSRLQFGIKATQDHLHRVEQAEDFVRELVGLEAHMSMRVRFLAGNRAAVELDNAALEKATRVSKAIDAELQRLGFDAVTIRPFRSGSLSGYNANADVVQHTPASSTQAREV